MKRGSQPSHQETDSGHGGGSRASGQARREITDAENAAKLREVQGILHVFKAKGNGG